jgi:hypothetical protein
MSETAGLSFQLESVCHEQREPVIFFPSGWAVGEDVVSDRFDVGQLEPVSFLSDAEIGGRIGGDELRRRAIRLNANLGLADARYILANQQAFVGFGAYKLLFPGTVVYDREGVPCISCLCPVDYLGGRLGLSFYCLGNDFDDDFRLVRAK